MSLQDIVQAATDVIERPDYTLANSYVRSVVRRALGYVHSLRDFEQDLKDVVEPVLANSSSIAFTLPDDYRHLAAIRLLDSDGMEITGLEFKRGKAHRRPSDHFGCHYPNYYYTLGQEIRVWWEANIGQGSILMTYFASPQLTFDESLNVWDTDSWIAARFPDVISYQIAKSLAAGVETSQLGALANLSDECIYALLNDVEI